MYINHSLKWRLINTTCTDTEVKICFIIYTTQEAKKSVYFCQYTKKRSEVKLLTGYFVYSAARR